MAGSHDRLDEVRVLYGNRFGVECEKNRASVAVRREVKDLRMMVVEQVPNLVELNASRFLDRQAGLKELPDESDLAGKVIVIGLRMTAARDDG